MLTFFTSFLFPAWIFIGLAKAEFYSEADFNRVKKIDTHTHHNSDDPALVEAAKAANFFLLTVNVDAPSYPNLSEQTRFALIQKRANPTHIDLLSTISLADWAKEEWVEQEIRRVAETLEQGALGIKIWKNIGMTYRDDQGNFIMADHPRLEPIFQFLEEQDKTLMAHLGEPKNCWLPLEEMTVNNDRTYFKEHPEYHMYLQQEFPSYDEQIEARDRLLEKFPNLRVVGAHLGSLEWSVDELAKRLDRFPNFAVDLAARMGHLQVQSQTDYKKVRDFVINYQDRLIYGTDLGISESSNPESVKSNALAVWKRDWKYLVTNQDLETPEVNGPFKGLQLPKEVVDKIYFHNAVRWFKPTIN
jgi:predicted TIM-barrel fold metal-dependent hydrolase